VQRTVLFSRLFKRIRIKIVPNGIYFLVKANYKNTLAFFDQYYGAPHLESIDNKLAINIFGALHLKIEPQSKYKIFLHTAPPIDYGNYISPFTV
jgi:hypothetical protein